jgi:hypothetical protein
LDNPLHIILNNSKLAYRIYVILIANKESIKKFNSSPGIIRIVKSRRMRWAVHVARMGEKGKRLLAGKPEGRRPLGRPRCRVGG